MNFDALPNSKPAGFVVPEGAYKAVIADPVMRQPKDTSKPMYLSFKLDLYDFKSGEKVGSVFDNLFESQAPLALYKIKRFMIATEIKLSQFELSDLAKLISGKTVIVHIKTEKQEGRDERSVVDAFKDEIYYPLSEANKVFGEDTEDVTIKATDGVEETTSDDDIQEIF